MIKILPNSTIVLCNCNRLDNTYDNSYIFRSPNDQLAFFAKKSIKNYNNYSYIRQTSSIKIEANIELIYNANYLYYTNTQNKRVYCFINHKEYINEEVTELFIEIDVIQTYMFDYQLGECFVDRMHVPRWTKEGKVIENLEPEDIEMGEYIQIAEGKICDLENNYLYVTSEPLGTIASRKPNSGGGILPPSCDTRMQVSNEHGDNWSVPTVGEVTALFPTYPSGSPHSGLDIACPVGTNVVASKDGTVVEALFLETSYGYHLRIDHGNGLLGIYAHNSELLVSKGDVVKKNQVIAKSGNTGNSTGAHCHFELRYNNVAFNPAPSLKIGDVISLVDCPSGSGKYQTDRGIYFMKTKEGFCTGVYIDPVGKATQGYGMTNNEIVNRDITEAEATTFLCKYSAENYLKPFLINAKSKGCDITKITSNMGDAIVSFLYNLGLGATYKSTWFKLLCGGDFGSSQAFWDSWLAHNKGTVNGETVVLPGLKKRREEEEQIWKNKTYPPVSIPILAKGSGNIIGTLQDNDGLGAAPVIVDISI